MPRTGWHFCLLYESPVNQIQRPESQVIPNGRRHVDPGAMIEIRRRPLLTEHIRRMICAERSHVLPPGITSFEPMANLKPVAFAYALVRTAKAFNKPWHHFG